MNTQSQENLQKRIDTLESELSEVKFKLTLAHHQSYAGYDTDWSHLNNCINAKETQRQYVKVGKKYIPVNDPYAYDGLRNGFWLVKVENGSTSIRQQIYPQKVHITAAARLLEDKLVKIIREACEARTGKKSLTPQEKADWDAFIKRHGESFNTLHYPSFQENAEKIVKAILDEDY